MNFITKFFAFVQLHTKYVLKFLNPTLGVEAVFKISYWYFQKQISVHLRVRYRTALRIADQLKLLYIQCVAYSYFKKKYSTVSNQKNVHVTFCWEDGRQVVVINFLHEYSKVLGGTSTVTRIVPRA